MCTKRIPAFSHSALDSALISPLLWSVSDAGLCVYFRDSCLASTTLCAINGTWVLSFSCWFRLSTGQCPLASAVQRSYHLLFCAYLFEIVVHGLVEKTQLGNPLQPFSFLFLVILMNVNGKYTFCCCCMGFLGGGGVNEFCVNNFFSFGGRGGGRGEVTWTGFIKHTFKWLSWLCNHVCMHFASDQHMAVQLQRIKFLLYLKTCLCPLTVTDIPRSSLRITFSGWIPKFDFHPFVCSGGEIQKNSAAVFYIAKFLTDEKDCQLSAHDYARGDQVIVTFAFIFRLCAVTRLSWY